MGGRQSRYGPILAPKDMTDMDKWQGQKHEQEDREITEITEEISVRLKQYGK